mgnify:CR=1 FL=1
MRDAKPVPPARLRSIDPEDPGLSSSGLGDENGLQDAHTEANPAVVTTLADLPLMLTVTEAASVLRISRATAYKLIDEHRASRGATGIEHVRFGSRILIRRSDLARLVGTDQPG